MLSFLFSKLQKQIQVFVKLFGELIVFLSPDGKGIVTYSCKGIGAPGLKARQHLCSWWSFQAGWLWMCNSHWWEFELWGRWCTVHSSWVSQWRLYSSLQCGHVFSWSFHLWACNRCRTAIFWAHIQSITGGETGCPPWFLNLIWKSSQGGLWITFCKCVIVLVILVYETMSLACTLFKTVWMKTLYNWIGNRAFDPTMLTRPKLPLNLAAEDLVIISLFLKTRLSFSVNCDILSDVSCWCLCRSWCILMQKGDLWQMIYSSILYSVGELWVWIYLTK